MIAVCENLGLCNVIRNQTSPNFFARSLMISRTFVLNVFRSVLVSEQNETVLNCV